MCRFVPSEFERDLSNHSKDKLKCVVAKQHMLNKHIQPINYVTQVNPTHWVTYSKIVYHSSVQVNFNDLSSFQSLFVAVKWLVGREVLIEGDQNILVISTLKKDTELFWGLEKFKLLLQELFPVGGDEFKRGVLRATGLKFTSN